MKILSKIQILIFATLFLAISAGMFSAFRLAASVADQEFKRQSQALCLSLKLSSEEAIRGYRDFLLQDYVNDMMSQPDVVHAYVLDFDGTALAHSDLSKIGTHMNLPEGVPKPELSYHKDIYEVSLPVKTHHGEGRAVVALSTTTLREKIRKLAVRIGIVGLFVAGIALLLASLVARKLLYPIRQLQKGMLRVSGGDLKQKIPVLSRDELAELTKAFNEMMERLLEANEKLKKAQLQLMQSVKMAAVGQLGASVAHEINNPLTSLMGFAQYALGECSENPALSTFKEDLQAIYDQGVRCKNIVENLLNYTRVGGSREEDVDLNKIIRDSLSLTNYELYRKGITMKVDLDPDLPKIRGSSSALQQVFVNLIVNAGKAMEQKGELKVITRLAKQNGESKIEAIFSDTGCGISQENLPKIFDPYFTTRAEEGGTGLGLSISQEIIERHGGKILVESQVNQGSTFRILLPLNENYGTK